MSNTKRMPIDFKEILTPELSDIVDKITSIDNLPAFEEACKLCYELWDSFDKNVQINGRLVSWPLFCMGNEIHEVYNAEFIDALAEEIRRLGNIKTPIVEVCAGDGKLSYHLRKKGIEVIATDDYSFGISNDETLVEKLSSYEALKKYNPEIVIGAWLPYKAVEMGLGVIDFPSVKYFFDIGEGAGGASWLVTDSENYEDRNKAWFELKKRSDLNIRYIENPSKYCISRTSCPIKYDKVNGHSVSQTSSVILFERV